MNYMYVKHVLQIKNKRRVFNLRVIIKYLLINCFAVVYKNFSFNLF